MKKLLFVSTLCLSSVFAFSGKAQEKSIIEQPKPKPVTILTYQKKAAHSLKNAGNGLIGGVLLSALGGLILSKTKVEKADKQIGTFFLIGSGASFIYSGVSLIDAAQSYGKSLKQQKTTQDLGDK